MHPPHRCGPTDLLASSLPNTYATFMTSVLPFLVRRTETLQRRYRFGDHMELKVCSRWYVPLTQVAYNFTVNFPNVLRQSCLVIISTYW